MARRQRKLTNAQAQAVLSLKADIEALRNWIGQIEGTTQELKRGTKEMTNAAAPPDPARALLSEQIRHNVEREAHETTKAKYRATVLAIFGLAE